MNTVISEALGYLPEYIDQAVPSVEFELGGHFAEFSCRKVAPENWAAISAQLLDAFVWCANRFPLSLKTNSAGLSQQTISQFVVGHSIHSGELLTASSAQARGVVLMAAPWPVKNNYRLASLIAHESMHQALYAREQDSSPVRPNSLGYSPWKNTLRPGRLVWHSFWTFVCQFTMLSEAVLGERSLLQADPKLANFLADMQARILACSNSLRYFELLRPGEMDHCEEALSIVNELGHKMLGCPGYKESWDKKKDEVFGEFETWAAAFLESQTDNRRGVGAD